MLRERLFRLFYASRIAANAVPHYLYAAKILNCDPLESSSRVNFLKELNSPTPTVFHGAYALSHTVMIRSLITMDIKR